MPRRKVDLKRIENRAAMQVTFSKRKKGLFKKAQELSIMCDAQVLVLVFSAASKLTQYANPSVGEILERYKTHQLGPENPSIDLSTKEIERLRKEVDERDLTIRQLKGENLDNLSIEQLIALSELTLNGFYRQKAKEMELYEKTIVKFQHPSHDLSKKYGRQKQETRAENVVHHESMSPKLPLTTNSNCEDALHKEREHYGMKVVELQHTKNLIEEIGRQKQEAGAENVVYQESMTPKLVVTPNSNCEDALHNLCLKL